MKGFLHFLFNLTVMNGGSRGCPSQPGRPPAAINTLEKHSQVKMQKPASQKGLRRAHTHFNRLHKKQHGGVKQKAYDESV